MRTGDLVLYTEENNSNRIMAMILLPPNEVGNVKLLLPSGTTRIISATRISLLPKRGNYLKC